jgi:hypothetical protein
MNKQILVTAVLGSILSVMITSVVLFFGQALAAPAPRSEETLSSQSQANSTQSVSISSMAFQPTQANVPFFKDTERQMLGLAVQGQGPRPTPALLVAPLMLPDRSGLEGLTVFGEDFDNQGEVRLRLKRCDHGQARCVNLADTTSTLGYNFGQFETTRINFSTEIIDNNAFSYFLETELSALAGSGLRSVRLEIIPSQATTPSGNAESWSLSGNTLNFTVPNTGYAQVRVCAGDLSGLNNVTHYPFVVVDHNPIPLSSNSCVTVWGYDIQVSRRPNTGPSSGTYQILR